jgi:leader peptidase (prepilin peptidase)/N-methyltransferase
LILSAIDFEHHRLPNKVLFPGALIAVVLLGIAAAAQNDWQRLFESGLGVLAYGLPILAIGLACPAGMGGGDIKLAAYLGLHLGWFGLWHVLVGALLGVLLGGLSGTALLLAGKKGRKDPIPFGPFMAVGAVVSVLAGSRILDFWLG